MGEKFEMPVPRRAGDDLAEELEKSHLAWVKDALGKAPDDLVIAVVMTAAAAGALVNGLTKEDFVLLATKTYERVEKMPLRASVKQEADRG
jgi:hypothetical protein